MCVPAVAVIIQGIGMAIGAMSAINSYKQSSDAEKYKAQASLVNMQIAKQNADDEIQKGIDEARKEKIKGIQKASLLMAKNASGGFDLNSETNILNQESLLGYYDEEGKELKEKYELSANKYYTQANGYLNDSARANKNAKNELYNLALKGLGATTSVAQRWYKTGSIF